tara:strand:+ start:215 stop:802 length:588 start_codon:yes stop_codon:yes gene_type:complete
MTTNSIRIYPENYHYLNAEKPKSRSMTAHINMILENRKNGLDTCDTLKIPNERERETKKEGGILSNTNRVPNSINKEKENLKKKRFKFSADLIPFELETASSLIVDFWHSKKGKKTEAAFNLLMGEKGLIGIKKKYGEDAVKDQITLAIANEWQSITLKNYENFCVSNKNKWPFDPEPPTGHPAQRLFTASRGFD